jgi:PLD-like domain
MFVVNGGLVRIDAGWGPLEYTDHFSLIRGLIASCDSCLLVSPFLFREFEVLFKGVLKESCQVELITSCAPRGQDQFDKPFALRSFGRTIAAATGRWPAISINQTLHSKIYVFSRQQTPFAAVVTSANMTESGLSRNHETGVLVLNQSDLRRLMDIARGRLDYVRLTEDQIARLCTAVEAYEARYPRNVDDRDVDLGLKNILNTYTTPSAENRNVVLSPNAFYYIKVSGVKDRPILPHERRRFDTQGRNWISPKALMESELGIVFLRSPLVVSAFCRTTLARASHIYARRESRLRNRTINGGRTTCTPTIYRLITGLHGLMRHSTTTIL